MALIDTYRRNVTRKRDEIAKLTSEKAKEKNISVVDVIALMNM